MAERANLSARAVSDLERGENRSPRRDTLDLLADALELPPADRVALEATIVRTRVGTPPQTALDPAPTPTPTSNVDGVPGNLPAQPTPFIGREHEIAVVRACLLDPETRLLTLTGPGGVGKTRLALQTAAAARAGFANGVVFVALAALADADLVLPTVAQALGACEEPGQPIADTLAAALHDKRVLLVLDNFEQVLAAANAAQALLLAAPGVTMLTTSREPLHVRGERVHPVGPLEVPTPPLPPLGALSQYEAVKLFIARAADADPAFAITNETAPAVAEICARLDGLPLAIELVAARVRSLSPETLLARLSNRLKVATGGARDLPERQRTLRAAIDWSYSLLHPGERMLFWRLAVFVGGCTLGAIEAVCERAGDLSIDALDGVESLLDKSLLRREVGADGEPRFAMLETIHEYARERLEERGEVDTLRQAHAAYFVALTEEAKPKLLEINQGVWLARLEAEHDNVRAVLQRAHADSQGELGFRIIVSLRQFWRLRGYSREGYDWAKLFLTCVDRTQVETRLLEGVLTAAGVLASDNGDYDWARTVFVECVTLTQADENGVQHAKALNNLATMELEQGNHAVALELEQQSLSISRANGDNVSIVTALDNMGVLARIRGDYSRAAALSEEALAVTREPEDPFDTALLLHNLALHVVELGDYNRARLLFQQSVGLYRRMGYTMGEVEVIQGVAYLASKEGDQEQAACLFGAAAALRVTFTSRGSRIEQAIFDAQIVAVRANLSNDSFTRAWAEGQTLSIEQASTKAATHTVASLETGE